MFYSQTPKKIEKLNNWIMESFAKIEELFVCLHSLNNRLYNPSVALDGDRTILEEELQAKVNEVEALLSDSERTVQALRTEFKEYIKTQRILQDASTSPIWPTDHQSVQLTEKRLSTKRFVSLDGPNLGYSYNGHTSFSIIGVKTAVDYFQARGHEVVAVLPQKPKFAAQNEEESLIVDILQRRGQLLYTSPRDNDDYTWVKMAYDMDGIMVSSDKLRDLQWPDASYEAFVATRRLKAYFSTSHKVFVPDLADLHNRGIALDTLLG